MDDDSYIVDENEPTFNVEEWMSELEADDLGDSSAGKTGMEAAGVSFLSANAIEHRNNEKTDEKFWPRTEFKSDLFSGMCQTPMPTASNSDNFSGLARMGMFPTTSPMVKSELSSTRLSQHPAPELKLRQKVQESVFQHSQSHSNRHYQIQQEPLAQLQTSQQYMSTTMQQTAERWNILNSSNLPLAEAGLNSVIGSSTQQLDMSENYQKCIVQTYGDLMQQPRIGSNSDAPFKPESMISQQNLEQVQRPMQLYNHFGAQNLRNEISHGMQKKIQANSPSQGLMIGGQLQPTQFPQRMTHEGSSASINMAQNGVLFSNFAEWHDEAYNQLLTMKRLYLTEVMGVYQRYQDLSSIQPSNAEFAIRLEKNRNYVGRIIKFLNMPKSDIVHSSKEKMYNYMNQVTNFIYQSRAKLSVPSQYHHPIAQPQRLLQNRNFQFNMPNGGSASATIGPNRFVTGKGLANVGAGSSFISQRSSLSQGWLKPRVPDLLQPCSTGLSHHNALSSALMNSSPNEIFGAYGSSIREAPLDSPVFGSQNLRNCEDRLYMQANKMHQPHQPLIDQHKQHKIVVRSENSDLRFRESMCFSPTKFQQKNQEATSQHINHFPQTVLSSNFGQPHVAPLESGQSSSPQVDSNDFSSKVSKGSMTLQSTGSPFVFPSPSTPLTPSSSLVDHVKKSSSHSPSLISGEDSRAPVLLSQSEPLSLNNNNDATDMLEVENSQLPPHVESEEVAEPNAENGYFKRLLDVVKSSSQKALNSALQDIGAVTNLLDRRAGATLVDDSRYITYHDLSDEIQYSWQDNDLLNFEYEVLPSSACVSESFLHLTGESLNSESLASKRLKTEANYLLMQEIKEVNKRLVETVVEFIVDKTGSSAHEANEETIIHCSYLPVGQFATSHVGFPGLLLRLLVDRDYPHSSPSVLDVNPYKCGETKEVQEITQKVKSKFSLSLRKFSEPMSVTVMVKAFDVSAREVYHECAKKFGGECFSSRYGEWKGCVTAA